MTKHKERKKQKGLPFPTANNYQKRDILFQAGPGPVTYNEAIQQKKTVVIICDSMPKSVKRKRNQKKTRKEDDLFNVKLSEE